MAKNQTQLPDLQKIAHEREYLLNYFGEKMEQQNCGFCDNCKAGVTKDEEGELPFPLNSSIIHKSWGKGVVMRYESDKMVILFEQVGYQTLAIEIVLQEDLLQLSSNSSY